MLLILFGRKDYSSIGLEFDLEEVRLVEIKKGPGGPVVSTAATAPLPRGAVMDGEIIDPETVAPVLRELWASNGLPPGRIVLGLANQSVLARIASLPRVPEDKLEQTIRFQAQDFLPMSLDSALFDYLVLGENTSEEPPLLDVMLVAARREMVDKFVDALALAGLKPYDITYSPLSLIELAGESSPEGALALVNVGNGLTNVTVVADGMPRFVRTVGVSLKEAAAALDSSLEEVIDSAAGLAEEEERVQRWVSNLINEVRSSVTYYQGQRGARPVEEIILSGPGARMPGLADQMGELFEVRVRTGRDFSGPQLSPRAERDYSVRASDFAVATSLALMGLEG